VSKQWEEKETKEKKNGLLSLIYVKKQNISPNILRNKNWELPIELITLLLKFSI
jgi:hypothetical protein